MCISEFFKNVVALYIIEDYFSKRLYIEFFYFSSNFPHFHVNVFGNVTSVLLRLQTFQQLSINNASVTILF